MFRCFAGMIVCAAALLVLLPAFASADDAAYYRTTISELKLTDGALPQPTADADRARVRWNQREVLRVMTPYAVLDGPGEIHIVATQDFRWDFTVVDYWQATVVVRAPAGKDVAGRLFVPKHDLSGMAVCRFVIPASAADADHRGTFYERKADYYERLMRRNAPGAAWFRHQIQQAEEDRTGEPVDPTAAGRQRTDRGTELEQTYAIFTGGRALSENLQLERVLQVDRDRSETVDVESLPGITVNEIDWKPLIKGLDPQKDPLAALIPADQHALFFPSFAAVITMVDEAKANGTPILRLIDSRSEDARTQGRYERQLCVSLDAAARLLGPTMVQSVAVTGSDPYLRTGSDVAVLFEAKLPAALVGYLAARHKLAAEQDDAETVSGTVSGVKYTGVRSPDRAVCSYVATLDKTVVVTNSLAQLERIARTHQDELPTLKALDEYTFFRDRYPLGEEDETALLIVTDATLRRWCGPRWRIGTSRRTRAAALLASLQAEYVDQIVEGKVEKGTIHTPFSLPDIGKLRLTAAGPTSSVYGDLEFNTPILELGIDQVTKSEAEAYRQFRERYQRNWRQFYDPIAVRFSVDQQRIAADVTVMPLIQASEYREFIRLTGDAKIAPDGGDPHDGSLLHWAMALDKKSPLFRESSSFLSAFAPDKGNPLGWLGESIALYADDDAFWQEAAAADDPQDFIAENYPRLPVAFRAEISSSLKAAVFLTTLRAFAEQAAPDLTVWSNHEHNGRTYVKIAPKENRFGLKENFAIYYSVSPEALVVTLREDLLRRSIDRELARDEAAKSGEPLPKPPPWIGDSMTVRVGRDALQVMQTITARNYQQVMQLRAWNALPVLNEWHRRWPDSDPVALHERLWQRRLVCPGGGEYVWNEQFGTMESTVYGHPGHPKKGPIAPEELSRFRTAQFGITFENQGLRAKVDVQRDKR